MERATHTVLDDCVVNIVDCVVGYPSLPLLVKAKQKQFLRTMCNERSFFHDDPLMLVLDIVRNSNTPTRRIIDDLINGETIDAIKNTRDDVMRSSSSRCQVYTYINSNLVVHDIYRKRQVINEHHRR